jgi:hypothetical protein
MLVARPGDFSAGYGIYDAGGLPWTLAVLDFDADGRPDVLAGLESSTTLTLLRNITPPGSAMTVLTEQGEITGLASMRALLPGDFNADGNADVLIGSADVDGVQVMLGDGTGDFTAGPAVPLPARIDSLAGAMGGVAAMSSASGEVFILDPADWTTAAQINLAGTPVSISADPSDADAAFVALNGAGQVAGRADDRQFGHRHHRVAGEHVALHRVGEVARLARHAPGPPPVARAAEGRRPPVDIHDPVLPRLVARVEVREHLDDLLRRDALEEAVAGEGAVDAARVAGRLGGHAAEFGDEHRREFAEVEPGEARRRRDADLAGAGVHDQDRPGGPGGPGAERNDAGRHERQSPGHDPSRSNRFSRPRIYQSSSPDPTVLPRPRTPGPRPANPGAPGSRRARVR